MTDKDFIGMGCEAAAFAALLGQATPSLDTPAWVQGGLAGIVVLILGWIGKVMLPGKDAALAAKDGAYMSLLDAKDVAYKALLDAKDVAYKLLLDAKDAQLAKKDETLLDVIKAGWVAGEKESDKFVGALAMVGDKFQAAMLRCESDHEKRDTAWEIRIEKLVEAFSLEGKESREHLQREREAETKLRCVERDQREKADMALHEKIARLTTAVEGRNADPRN